MLRVSKLTDYASIITADLAANPAEFYSAGQLAEQARLPVPTVRKVLKKLLNAKLLVSLQGSQGGYQLSRSAKSITLAELVEAIEGPISVTECSAHPGSCSRESLCQVRSHWQAVHQAIYDALNSITIRSLTT